MKRLVPGIVLALAAVVAALAAAPAVRADEPAPDIVIPKLRHDFGKVFESEQYRYSFVVENRGDADLRIESVRPGCGCTLAQYDSVIAPGAQGRIELVVDGGKVHGSFDKSATVYTNDPEHPTMKITIAGDEISYVDITPGERVYLQGGYGESVSKTIRVRSNEDDLDFQVTGLSSDMDDRITYRYEKGKKEGEYQVIITKNPRLPAMNTFGSLIVHTNSVQAPEAIVQVQVITKGSIAVQPSTLNFGRLEFPDGHAGDPVTKSVTLLKPDGGFSIESIELTNHNYNTDVQEIIPGKRYQIKVTFTPPARQERRQKELGELTVLTNDPREPRVTVRLVANGL